MSDAIVAVIGLVGSAAGAIWAAYVGTRRRVLTELEGRYDADLRGLRLTVYPKLWAALEPLALYAREPAGRPTRGEMRDLALELRRWYFAQGGLYLSEQAREAYFQLQAGLTVVTTSERWIAEGAPAHELDPDTYESLRRLGSWLRTARTHDVGTRRRFSLAPAWQKKNAEEDEEAIEADRAEKRATKEMLERLRSTWSA
jgi:hypothetical protein